MNNLKKFTTQVLFNPFFLLIPIVFFSAELASEKKDMVSDDIAIISLIILGQVEFFSILYRVKKTLKNKKKWNR